MIEEERFDPKEYKKLFSYLCRVLKVVTEQEKTYTLHFNERQFELLCYCVDISTPKKPTGPRKKMDWYRCPVCKVNIDPEWMLCCRGCGQRLDWSYYVKKAVQDPDIYDLVYND